MSKLKVAIVILNWNGVSYLKRFLSGVITNSRIESVEVIIADNGSSDDSIIFLKSNYPNVKIISLDQNYGFSTGYNLALKQIDAEYYVLLNSDVEVPAGWLIPLINFMDSNPNASACMPKMLDYNRKNYFEYAGACGGFVDSLGYPYCRGRILSVIEEDKGQYNDPLEIFWASGACMFVRAKSYWDAGGLDDDFFAHMEEIDLCWRMKRLGYTIWCIPDSYVFHVGGGTLPNNNPRKLMLNYRNSLFMLYKNLSRKSIWFVFPVRFLLDIASSIVYFFTFRFTFFTAVFKAHRSFWKYRRKMEAKKISIKSTTTVHLKGIILFDFFIKGKKTFSQFQGN